MKTRMLCLAVLLLAMFATKNGSQVARAQSSNDLMVLRNASQALGHGSAVSVLQWLRGQQNIVTARFGKDGRTLDLRFRSGFRADILPATTKPVKVLFKPRTAPAAPMQQVSAGTALVLEPFATELGLGPSAGSVEVQALQGAGFVVSQAYDTQVTVASMLSLSHYNVVYMSTHSGINQSGRAVVATGQPANGDPGVAPYLADGSVVVVGVAGSTQPYYAITSTFITAHEPKWKSPALVFLNGCSLLSTPDFGQALLGRGAGVLVSWNQEATAQDNFLAAAAFFNVMAQGASVASAISALVAAHYGVSTYQGLTATLGFQGDGTITLARTLVITVPLATPTSTTVPTSPPATLPPPPPFPTTVALTPTQSATSTPLPAPTATAVATAAPVLQASLLPVVTPEGTQRITAHYAPNSVLVFRVVFPNGDTHAGQQPTDASGMAQFVLTQHASRISRESTLAAVQVSVLNSTVTPVNLQYRIGFSPIDASVEPRVQTRGHNVAIWVHSRGNTRVKVSILVPGKQAIHLNAITGSNGWADIVHKISAHAGRNETVIVRADVTLRGHNRGTRTSYHVS